MTLKLIGGCGLTDEGGSERREVLIVHLQMLRVVDPTRAHIERCLVGVLTDAAVFDLRQHVRIV